MPCWRAGSAAKSTCWTTFAPRPSTGSRSRSVASVGVLISKTMQLSNDVYNAMLARGFRGEVYVLDDFRTAPFDWIALEIGGERGRADLQDHAAQQRRVQCHAGARVPRRSLRAGRLSHRALRLDRARDRWRAWAC